MAAQARRADPIEVTEKPAGKLSEFSFSGRLGAFTIYAALGLALYLLFGYEDELKAYLMLGVAFIVAFSALWMLARLTSYDAPWLLVLPTAVSGAALGGFAAAGIAEAPDWRDLLDMGAILNEWALGTAFSAFFVGLALATTAVQRAKQLEYENKQKLLEERLKTLTARIEPHFLMNTLANLRYLVKSDPTVARSMLDHLADFLQGALERTRDLDSTLGHELQTVDSYLSIMQLRLGTKLEFSIEAPDELRKLKFPALLLQTLVENAVAHGIEPGDETGHIWIEACRDGGDVVVSVVDDGVGFDTETRTEGVGLRNVRQRLESLYPGESSFSIRSDTSTGTRAIVTFPISAASP